MSYTSKAAVVALSEAWHEELKEAGIHVSVLAPAFVKTRYGHGGDLRWALAGRSEDKVRAVMAVSGLSAELPVIAADSGDPVAMQEMVARTRGYRARKRCPYRLLLWL